MRAAISDSIIAQVQQAGQFPVDLWDIRVSGLVLRLRASGQATWLIRTTTQDGRRTSIKVGEHPHLSPSEARRQAVIHLGHVQRGGDPVAERKAVREQRRAAAAALTVEKALTEWQAARSNAVEKPWSPRHARATASAIRTHISDDLGRKVLRDISRETWTRIVTRVARDRPGAAAHLYTLLSSFLGYAEAMGWIEHHPLPRRGRSVIAPHLPPRTRVLDDHEWLAIWKAAEREPTKLRAFIRLLILTACRVSEVADIALGEVVANGTVWVIPASRTKNKREHIVPLGELAQRELRLVWPSGDQEVDAGHMLLGRSGKSGFTGTGKLLTRAQQASGTKDWTWHDLRRTARTGMSYLSVSEADAEAALNHVTRRGGLIAIYDQSGPPASALTALRTWQAYVADVVEGRCPAGDAEQRYRAGLPEELRYRSRPKFVPRIKAKPGRSRRKGMTSETMGPRV